MDDENKRVKEINRPVQGSACQIPLCNCAWGLPRWLSEKLHLPMQEKLVHSPGLGDRLKKEMTTHSHILAWKILWTEEPSGLVYGVAKSWTCLSN